MIRVLPFVVIPTRVGFPIGVIIYGVSKIGGIPPKRIGHALRIGNWFGGKRLRFEGVVRPFTAPEYYQRDSIGATNGQNGFGEYLHKTHLRHLPVINTHSAILSSVLRKKK